MLLTALSAGGHDHEEPAGLVLLAADNSVTLADAAAEMWLAELGEGGPGEPAPAGGTPWRAAPAES